MTRKDLVGVLVIIGVLGPMSGIAAWEIGGHYVYGTTPAEVAAMSLEGTPKQLAKSLALTDVQEKSMRARFRVSSARPYELVEFQWNSKAPNAPYSMTLEPEHSKDEEHGTEMMAALGRRFHAMHDGRWSWGRFEVSVNKESGEIAVRVEPIWNKKPNPLFERQMDAARQVALEAAFGIPPHATDAELAELLGTGYKAADVGKIDPQTTIEDAPALMASRFPGSIHDDSSSWQIAIDHPLIEHVTFGWSNSRGGHVNDVSIFVNESYPASRDGLEACLANVLGPPQKNYVFDLGSVRLLLERTSISLERQVGYDGAVLAKIFDALGGCRDKAENTGARGDGRKK